MASTRLVSLVIFFTIALTGFESAIRVRIEPQTYNELNTQLNITCITDGPTQWDTAMMTIILKRQGRVMCITHIYNVEDPDMTLQGTDNMKVDFRIDNKYNKVYTTLMINQPGIHDGGLYECVMHSFRNSILVHERDAANVTFNGPVIRTRIEPQPYNELDTQLNVTCITNGPTNWDKAIMTILLKRQGRVMYNADIYKGQKPTMVLDGTDNMEAEFRIDKQYNKIYTTLMINQPGILDGGLYECVMHGFRNNRLVHGRETANVTYNVPDITVILKDLAQKVQEQNTKIVEQTKQIDYLTKQFDIRNTLFERLSKDCRQKQALIDHMQQQFRKNESQFKNLTQKSGPNATTPSITTTLVTMTTSQATTPTITEADITGIAKVLAQKVQEQNTEIDKLTNQINRQNLQIDYLTNQHDVQKTLIERLKKDSTQKQTLLENIQQQIRKHESQFKKTDA